MSEIMLERRPTSELVGWVKDAQKACDDIGRSGMAAMWRAVAERLMERETVLEQAARLADPKSKGIKTLANPSGRHGATAAAQSASAIAVRKDIAAKIRALKD